MSGRTTERGRWQGYGRAAARRQASRGQDWRAEVRIALAGPQGPRARAFLAGAMFEMERQGAAKERT